MVPADARAAFAVVIVGAGMSGLLAGIRLGQAGIPYTVVEKNPGVGGTWYENRYPGCRVDVGNHFYCYSFAPNDELDRVLRPATRAAALLRALRGGVRRRRPHPLRHRGGRRTLGRRGGALVRRGPPVAGDGVGGATETLDANALISAVGQLNRPKLPDIPGRDSFDGVGDALGASGSTAPT